MRKFISIAAALACLGLVPQGGPRHVKLSLHEGTNIAAALSPDGKTITFDLLGSIWTMPAGGGAARRITDELMDARQPAWSPDSKHITFQAYRATTWNIWTIGADGSALTQVTDGAFDDREPDWSPDGARIAFSSDRSGNYDIWVLTLASGQVRRVTMNAANDFGPAWSPDGRELAFASDRRDASGIYAIGATDAALGSGERLVQAQTGALAAPAWRPDGRLVAFNSIEGAHSALFAGGKEIGGADEDVFPMRPQWIAGDEILYTADGKIKRRKFTGGPATTVEFTADVEFDRPAFTPKRREFDRAGDQRVLGIMHPALSPDGKQVAFSALGDLWVMPVGGTPRRLTNDPFIELDAAWSPDGRSLAYSSDRDGTMRVYVRNLASGAERRATGGEGLTTNAAWSPDGNRIAFLRDGSQIDVADVSRIVGLDVPRDTSTPPVAARRSAGYDPGAPSWSPDGRYVVVAALHPNSTRFREGSNEVLRLGVAPDADSAAHWFDPVPGKSIGMREGFGPVWSPDGTQMAAIVDGRLAAFPVSRTGEPAGPLRYLSNDLAASPSWAGDSRHILYQAADRFRIVDVVTGSEQDVTPNLTWRAKTPVGTKVIHAGHLWDGESDALRTNVDIVVTGDRITSVEPHSAALHASHAGAVIDASNETVIPGLIEIHSHLAKSYGEALGRIWLAWGITTVRNPAGDAFEAAEDKESVESGRRIGPRVFSAGEPFDGTRIFYPGGSSLDGGAQLTQQLARTTALGFDFVKTYVRLPDLLQKRIVEESHKRGLPVTSHELYPAVAFGADGVEHFRGTSRRGYSPKQSQLMRMYDDVIQLLGSTGITVTPTIGIYGGFQLQTIRDSSWLADPRMAIYPAGAVAAGRAAARAPHSAADIEQRVKLVTPQEQEVLRILRAGGHVTAGTDSPINPYGLALHMEIEQYVDGGLTPLEALRTATTENAKALGMSADLGAIAPGRFADLVMLSGNPLADIHALRNVRSVMKNGELYSAASLLKRPGAAGAR